MRSTLPLLAFVCLLLAGLPGCGPSQEELANGSDPLAALRSTVASSRYGPRYWTEAMREDSATWREALRICAPAERADSPNCKTVNGIHAIGAPGPVRNPALSDRGFNP